MKFTSICEKQDVEIFRSHHTRQRQISGKGHYSKDLA